jgi:hypothetical protein
MIFVNVSDHNRSNIRERLNRPRVGPWVNDHPLSIFFKNQARVL